jgi:GTPase SAR1 family protein
VDIRNTNNESTVGNEKMISYKEGLALSRHINARHYIECSAKTVVNVKEVFEAAIRTVLIPCSKDKQDHKKRRCVVL